MKIALVSPGGVDPSGEYRVIPFLLALIRRLAARHEVHVFALAQEPRPARWTFEGAQIHNVGRPGTRVRAVAAIVREHRAAPFGVVQSIWAGWTGAVAVAAAKLLCPPSIVYILAGRRPWLETAPLSSKKSPNAAVQRGAFLLEWISQCGPLERRDAAPGCHHRSHLVC